MTSLGQALSPSLLTARAMWFVLVLIGGVLGLLVPAYGALAVGIPLLLGVILLALRYPGSFVNLAIMSTALGSALVVAALGAVVNVSVAVWWFSLFAIFSAAFFGGARLEVSGPNIVRDMHDPPWVEAALNEDPAKVPAG